MRSDGSNRKGSCVGLPDEAVNLMAQEILTQTIESGLLWFRSMIGSGRHKLELRISRIER